jgi:hypothetical protein
VILGNYDRYCEWRTLHAGPKPPAPAEPTSQRPQASKPARKKRKFPYRKTHEIEADITRHETAIAELEASLRQPEVYKDGRKAHEISQEITRLQAELEQLLAHWEEAMELNA